MGVPVFVCVLVGVCVHGRSVASPGSVVGDKAGETDCSSQEERAAISLPPLVPLLLLLLLLLLMLPLLMLLLLPPLPPPPLPPPPPPLGDVDPSPICDDMSAATPCHVLVLVAFWNCSAANFAACE